MGAYLILLILSVAQVLSLAATPELMTVDEALHKGLLLVAVRPTYPSVFYRVPVGGISSAGHQISGSGIFDLRFDYETGELREVHVVQSTGNRELDAHAIGALKLWKAKPRSIHVLRVPLTFARNT